MKKIKPIIKQIYIEGNIDNLKNKSIAIVGSRNCSIRGEKITKLFTKTLVKKGFTIISGMASGIDNIAHKMALNCGGKTMAILGCGLGKIALNGNLETYRAILANQGTIITEFPPEMEPKPKNYPLRNRIISGLSDGILVIEGKYRSGTGITGRLGLEQNKKVFCIPHNIEDNYRNNTKYINKKRCKTCSKTGRYFRRIRIHRK